MERHTHRRGKGRGERHTQRGTLSTETHRDREARRDMWRGREREARKENTEEKQNLKIL